MFKCSSIFYYILLIFLLIFIRIPFSREDTQTAKEPVSRHSTSFVIRETQTRPRGAPSRRHNFRNGTEPGGEGAQPRQPPAWRRENPLPPGAAPLTGSGTPPFPRLHAGHQSHEARDQGLVLSGPQHPRPSWASQPAGCGEDTCGHPTLTHPKGLHPKVGSRGTGAPPKGGPACPRPRPLGTLPPRQGSW